MLTGEELEEVEAALDEAMMAVSLFRLKMASQVLEHNPSLFLQ